jgi:hypothetical protein
MGVNAEADLVGQPSKYPTAMSRSHGLTVLVAEEIPSSGILAQQTNLRECN